MIKVMPITVRALLAVRNHYVRYGDGCWIVMTGKSCNRKAPMPQVNCDGVHLQDPDLKTEILKTVQSPSRNIIYGLTPFSKKCFEKEIEEICPAVEWYHGDLWKDSYLGNDTLVNYLVSHFKKKRLCFVGPDHLASLCNSLELPINFHFVTNKNKAHRQLKEATKYLFDIEKHIDIVLFSAGFMTQLLIRKLSSSFFEAGIQMLDMGAFWDPFCGVKSRAYH